MRFFAGARTFLAELRVPLRVVCAAAEDFFRTDIFFTGLLPRGRLLWLGSGLGKNIAGKGS